jgi:hypothetical protein
MSVNVADMFQKKKMKEARRGEGKALLGRATPAPLPDIKKITSMNIAIYGTCEQH